MKFALLFALTLSLSFAGCSDDHGDHCTDTTEAMCSGTQIRMCDGEHYGDPQDCPEGQACMTMDSGLTHCMLEGMMNGGTGHDMGDAGHDMGDAGHDMDHDGHSMGMDHDGHSMDHGPDTMAPMADM